MAYLKWGSSLALFALAACVGGAPDPIREIDTVEVPVAVATGCVAEEGRPTPVMPLNQQMTREEWEARPVGARASAVGAQAIDRMDYEIALRASTAGCE